MKDAIQTLGYLFLGRRAPPCMDAADTNDDGDVDVTDPTSTLRYLFSGNFPLNVLPDTDPSPDELDCEDPGAVPQEENEQGSASIGSSGLDGVKDDVNVNGPDSDDDGAEPVEGPGPILPLPGRSAPPLALDIARRFLEDHTSLGQAEGLWLGDLALGRSHPIYSPLDADLPSYFEIEVLDDGDAAGAIMVGLRKDDYPVASLQTDGRPLSEILRDQVSEAEGSGAAQEGTVRIVRYGVGFLAAEDAHGNLLGSLGDLPYKVLSLGEQGDEMTVEVTDDGWSYDVSPSDMAVRTYASYEDLRDPYATDFADEVQARAEGAREDWARITGTRARDGGGASSYTYDWAGNWSDQRYYSQTPSGEGPNTSSCYVGCGPTAWAMLYGWFEHYEGLSELIDGTVPQCDNTQTDNLQWVLRKKDLGTFCIGSQGFTYPSNMPYGYRWADRKGYGYNLSSKYCILGCKKAWKYPKEAIQDWGVPAIVGFDAHYAVAYGYAYNSSSRWFRCNTGWADRNTCSATRQWVKSSALWMGIKADFY